MKTPLLAVGLVCLSLSTGCATIVEGHERALFYSSKSGLAPETVPSGWHWHAPWNGYFKYDMRWDSHKEEIHIHSKDGLHMNIDVVVVVRPAALELFALHTEVGPDFYNDIVRPAVFAATRDASAKFNHMEIATQTHEMEQAIEQALIAHLAGKHLELGEVAIQHFDLPADVEAMANKKATGSQVLAAKEVDVKIAEADARIDSERRTGVVRAQGLERKLRAEQDLEAANIALQIEESKRKSEKVREEAEAEAITIKAKAEAEATRMRAEAEKIRIAASSQNLSPNYVRLQALEVLGKSISSGNTRMYVMPTGKDGLPMYFNPFMNPFGSSMTGMGAQEDDTPRK